MVKVLNIMTGGLGREGITSTQLEYMKHMDFSEISMYIASVYDAPSDIVEEFENYGCSVIQLPYRDENTIKYLCELNRIMHKEKFDVIHVHGSSSLMALELLLGKINGIKIRIAHSRNTMCLNMKFHKMFKKIFLDSYNVPLACGIDAGKWLFGEKDFYVLHNGKDFSKFKFNKKCRDDIRDKYLVQNKIVIGFVGNIIEQKNPSFLIDVYAEYLKKNKNAVLFIIGDGDLSLEIKKKVEMLAISESVIFTGRVNNVSEFLQAMDIMLLPSKYEGLPNVVLEAQISGLRCIISDKVTRECGVTPLAQFLPIDSVGAWVDCIEESMKCVNREMDSEQACILMDKNGFNIKDNCKVIENLYLTGCYKA